MQYSQLLAIETAAYMRSDLMPERTVIMNDWEKHIMSEQDKLVRNLARC